MVITDAKAFMATVAKCQLLSHWKLVDAKKLAELPDQTAQSLSKHLVEKGLLSRWQVEQLLSGQQTLTLGDYELQVKIGEGGMGAVYRALHYKSRRTVALKLMSEKVLSQPGALPRFHREIRAAAALDHPNIVAAYDADQVNDLHFLVMEYVEGKNLKNWLNEFGRLPIDFSCELIGQAAEGLEHAHEKGFVHRDIKPANLLVTAPDTGTKPFVKILDLGLARVVAEDGDPDRITKTGHVLGTIDYISPEQVADTRSVDIRGDIFSLGCTLFRAIAGQVPFEGRTLPEKVLSRMKGDAPKASRFRPDVPPELDSIIARMLARDPENRQQRPLEVVIALTRFGMGAGAKPSIRSTPTAPTAPTAPTTKTKTPMAWNPATSNAPASMPGTPTSKPSHSSNASPAPQTSRSSHPLAKMSRGPSLAPTPESPTPSPPSPQSSSTELAHASGTALAPLPISSLATLDDQARLRELEKTVAQLAKKVNELEEIIRRELPRHSYNRR